ncbi:MAG: DsbC family protein [Gammaproteobacteria bacterium]|jgi:thiol:disulfide interchange protein DsbC|nr:DsbC family protein [Gammaproteobacteria bacterium]
MKPFVQRSVASLSALTGLFLMIMSVATRGAVPPEYRFVQDLFPEVEVTNVRKSPLPGFLEMEVGADIFYVTDDGKYLVQGEVYDIATKVSLTENAKTGSRLAVLERFGDDKSILFAAPNPVTTITVFTDIDCGYCRKLHREIAEFNEKGISVRYLFFPRSGPDTESWAKAEAVWCADQQQEALTQAKNNVELPAADCDASVVAEHFAAVETLGLRGTPAILTEAGALVIGYRTADEILEITSMEL